MLAHLTVPYACMRGRWHFRRRRQASMLLDDVSDQRELVVAADACK